MMEINTQANIIYDKGAMGLPNIGNTCYMNSALQCILNNKAFKEYFRNKAFAADLDQTKISRNIVLQFERVFNAYWTSGNPGILQEELRKFHGVVNMIAAMNGIDLYRVGRQNDVHEFLSFLLNSLHEAVAYPVKVKINGIIKNDVDNLEKQAKVAWAQSHIKSYSKIAEMCCSQQRSCVVCPDCRNASNNFVPEYTISLSIPDKKIIKDPSKNVTLDDCLREFAKVEILDSDNKFKCEKCNNNIQAQKTLQIWRMPDVLTILLKRFEFNGNVGRKINVPVDYPMDLDLSDFCGGYDKVRAMYRLSGVCNHSGDVGGGHYYAFANGQNGWKKYNDESVSDLSEDDAIKSQAAYCLFYTRTDVLQ